MVGDVIHNLRSGLDHLAWQFALLAGDPGKECQFPLYRDKALFEKHGLPHIKEIRDEKARALIENVQPFQPTAPRWLRVALDLLHQVSNTDKHRVVLSSLVNLRALGTMNERVTVSFDRPRGLAKLAWGPLELSDDDMRVELHPQLVLDLDARTSTGHSVVTDMKACAAAVRHVVGLAVGSEIFPGVPAVSVEPPFRPTPSVATIISD